MRALFFVATRKRPNSRDFRDSPRYRFLAPAAWAREKGHEMPVKQLFALAALALCAACGGSGDEQASLQTQIEGDWGVSAGGDCVEVLRIGAERARAGIVCGALTGSAQAEVREGPYVLEGDVLTWEPDQASCDDAPRSLTYRVELAGGLLRLSDASGATLYERADTGEAQSVGVVFGCFGSDGFAPHPISPL